MRSRRKSRSKRRGRCVVLPVSQLVRWVIFLLIVLCAVFSIVAYRDFWFGRIFLEGRKSFHVRDGIPVIASREVPEREARIPFVGLGRAHFSSAPTEISRWVSGYRDHILHVSVVNARSFLLMSDIVSVPVEAEQGLVVSRMEQRKLQQSLHHGMWNATEVSGLYPTPTLIEQSPFLRTLAAEDDRLVTVFFQNQTKSLLTYQEMKENVLLYDTGSSGWSDASFNIVKDLLRFTGVTYYEEVDGEPPRFELTPPLYIHIHSYCVAAFIEYLFFQTPELRPDAAQAALNRWREWKRENKIRGDPPPLVPRRFILITVGSVHPPVYSAMRFTNTPLPATDFVKYFTDHPLLYRWISQNCDGTHPKVACVPLGLDFHTNSGKAFPYSDTFIDQQTDLLWRWFTPLRSENPVMKRQQEWNTDEDFIMGTPHTKPSDNLKELLMRAMNFSALDVIPWMWGGDFPTSAPIATRDGDNPLWEEVEPPGIVLTEKWESLLEKLNGAYVMPNTTDGECKVHWLPIKSGKEYVENMKRDSMHEFKVHIITVALHPPINKPPREFSISAGYTCSDALSLQEQMSCFGVYQCRASGQQGILIPVPAVFKLALEHVRPPGSLNERRLLVSHGFNYRNQPAFRRPAYKALRSKTEISIEVSGNRNTLWSALQGMVFTASPVGYGYDCHRTWEALLLGSVPILHHPSVFHGEGQIHNYAELITTDITDPTRILEVFSELPVVMVQNFDELSSEKLIAWQEEIDTKRRNGEYKWEKLFSQYWIDLFFSTSFEEND